MSRSNGNCYQGHEVVYLKKNTNAGCFDNRTVTFHFNKSCPCYLEDFQCRFNYYYKFKYCIKDEFSDFIPDTLKCEPGTQPVDGFDGFSKLDPGLCVSQAYNLITNKTYADICISNEYSNQILFTSMKNSFIYELDYMGNPFSKCERQLLSMPSKIKRLIPKSVDMLKRDIYYFKHHTLSVYKRKYDIFDTIDLYEFGFTVSSMAVDHHKNLLLILDSSHNLFVLCLKTNFLKLLAENVTDFEYSPNNLSMSFNTHEQICFYRFYLFIKCYQTDLEVKKFVYYEVSYPYALLLRNQTLLVYHGIDINLIKTQKAFLKVDYVSFFGLVKFNLYFIQKGRFIRIDLLHPTRLDLLSTRNFSDLLQLSAHVVYSEDSYKNLSKFKKYRCNPLIQTEDFCYDQEIEISHKHICKKYDVECLRRYCTGFQCGSSECLTNNIMCNGIKECRDGSDEFKCGKICRKTEHLCENVCIRNDRMCHSQKYQFHYRPITDDIAHKDYSIQFLSISIVLLSIFMLFILKTSRMIRC
ncbi:hypothetical protein RF11_06550 [Thelohanellus kitauei]|uniref:Sortilin C-terminal domain-containing protein n=1 Tax=Thelohanellus kitauei TaxID=669202 RepID=A0A0C2M0L2_THEKT|nr:hypothetical protein RF11_06550 [Thelohanellus kitauei]